MSNYDAIVRAAEAARRYDEATVNMEEARQAFYEAVAEAARVGYAIVDISHATGRSYQRIHQIVRKAAVSSE